MTTYEVEIIVNGRDNASAPLGRVGTALSRLSTIAGGVLGAGALYAVGRGIVNLASDAWNASVDMESAFTGIVKTTEGLVDANNNITAFGQQIRQEFRDIAKEIPITFQEIMKIGEIAGQLGVPEKALSSFSRVIAALGVTTNLTTEQGASDFARISNIFKVSADDMGSNAQHLGSSIVALGNNFATTEADIVEFAKRIAGAGKIAGLAQSDVVAIGAALSSVGVEAEAGGTAVQKVLLGITEAVTMNTPKLQKFAQTAGMSAEEFAAAWQDKPIEAFQSFVEGMGAAGNEAIGILDELGLKDQRLIRSFLSLSNAGDLLSRTVDMASTAWEENTALTEEAGRRYATTASRIQILKNKFIDFGASLGDIVKPAVLDWIEGFTPFFETTAPRILTALQNLAENGISFGDLLDFAGSATGIDLTGMLAPLSGIFDSLKGTFDRIMPTIETVAKTIGDKLVTAWQYLASNVIPWVVEQLGKFSDWFSANAPLIEAFVTKAGAAFNNFIGIFAGLWDVAEPLLSGIIDLVLNLATLIMQLATNDWQGAWETMKTTVLSAATAIWDTLVALVDWLLGIFGTNLQQVGQFFVNLWTNIVATTQGWITTLSGLIQGWIATAVSWFTGLAQKIQGDWMAIVTAVQSELSKFWEFLSAIGLALLGFIILFVDQIAAYFGTTTEQIITNIMTFLQNALAMLQALGASIWAALTQAWTSVSTALQETWNNIIASITAALGPMVEDMSGSFTEMSSTVSTKMSEMWSTFKTWWDKIVTQVNEYMTKVKTAVSGKVGEMVSAGRELIAGIAQGIRNGASEVINSIADVIGNAIARAKEILQIQSPSKVFAGFGENTMRGFAEGVRRSASLAVNSMGSTIGGIVAGGSNQSAAAGSQAGSIYNQNRSTVINLTVNNPKQTETSILDDIKTLQMLMRAA